MKSLIRVLIILFIVVVAGISSLQAVPQQAVLPETLHTQDTVLTSDEVISLVSKAHSTTVRSFSDAFEAELYEQDKPEWDDVRAQLLKYWSPELVDGELQTFYATHLWEWGYEMGFAFPLWKPEYIENVKIVSESPSEVIAEFIAPVNYETYELIRIRLVLENGNWIIVKQLYGQSV